MSIWDVWRVTAAPERLGPMKNVNHLSNKTSIFTNMNIIICPPSSPVRRTECPKFKVDLVQMHTLKNGSRNDGCQGKIPNTMCFNNIQDTWVKRDQLDVTCFIISLFNAQHVSDVNTSILRSLRLICWVISWVVLIWFDVCWCYVVVWLGWCGIWMQAKTLVLQPAYGYHTTTAKPQPTHIKPEQYNPWNNSAHKSQAPADGCINIRNMLSIK